MLLDFEQELPVFTGDEGPRYAAGAVARRTADAVDVLFRGSRNVIVDHVRDAGDVETTGGDIGNRQGLQLAIQERLDGLLTLRPQQVAMDGAGTHVLALEDFRDAVGLLLGLAEHHQLRRVEGLDEAREQLGPRFKKPFKSVRNGYVLLIDVAEWCHGDGLSRALSSAFITDDSHIIPDGIAYTRGFYMDLFVRACVDDVASIMGLFSSTSFLG